LLAILTTHPIQYQTPLWGGLAARKNIPFKVFYMSDHGFRARFDPGFGKQVSWNIDLLNGYESEFLDTIKGQRFDSFWGLKLKPGFGHALREMGVSALWLQGWQVAAYWQAVFAARQAGVQVWLRGETNGRSNSSGIGRPFKRVLLRQLLHRVDRLLYIGEANRQFYLKHGIDIARLAPAPYCVDNKRFAAQAAFVRPERERMRQEWRIPREAFCFLFAGKFIPKKRPLDIVEAARGLQRAFPDQRIHLLWVGTGELGGALREACCVHFDAETEKDVTSQGERNEPNASFVGFLNQSEISRAYVAADCLILPSNSQETWGLVVNEAMASGLPCIVSNACGCAEDLVEPIRPDLIYPVGDIAALESAMATAIRRPPGPKLLRAHIEKYGIDRTIDTVEALYFEVSQVEAPRSDPVLVQ
jgi:glycosyltransferase involved in cell wall biosynthesis